MENNNLDHTEVFIHIGLSKTGSTAIQRFLYENAGPLSKAGIIYPDNYRDVARGYKDWGHHIHSHKWGGWLALSSFPISPDEAWAELARTIQRSGNKIIISSERFQDLIVLPNYKDILKYIVETLSPARVKVVGYVRRQDAFAESHYKELVKNCFNTTSFENYLDKLPDFFDYYTFFERCSKVIGKENVIVRLFDKQYFYGGNIFSDFAHACGFVLPNDVKTSEKMTNPSLNSASTRVMSELSIRNFWRDPAFRSDIFAFFSENGYKDDWCIPLLDTKKRVEILNRFKMSNHRLIKRYLGDEYSDAFRLTNPGYEDGFDSLDPIFSTKDVIEILSAASRSYARTSSRIINELEPLARIINSTTKSLK